MWYLILGEDREDSLELRQELRERHLGRLRELQSQGRLLLAGPCPRVDSGDPGVAGYSGSLIVAEFASLEEAKGWMQADPYVSGGVYVHTVVKPFVQALPDG